MKFITIEALTFAFMQIWKFVLLRTSAMILLRFLSLFFFFLSLLRARCEGAMLCAVEAEEDEEEVATINHGWCHPPQSLWPARL